MNSFEILILSFALGIDCLVVSLSQGLLVRFKRVKISLLLALIMGIFQGLMPLLGAFLTGVIYDYVAPFANLLVFAIFTFLGAKFILEVFKGDIESLSSRLGIKVMLLLGVATSIDAMGAGISLRLTESPMFISCLVIGAGSFLMSLFGFWSGGCVKKSQTKSLEVLAGIILILLAIKALFM